MALTVEVLQRGGLLAYGAGRYDPREKVVIVDALEDEVLDVTMRFPPSTDVDEVDISAESGITISTPIISDNKISVQFQQLSSGGTVEFLAMMESGAAQRIRFKAHPNQPVCVPAVLTPTDDDDVDDGAWG